MTTATSGLSDGYPPDHVVEGYSGPVGERQPGISLSRVARYSSPLAAVGYLVSALVLTYPAWAHPAGRWIGVWGDPMKFMEFLCWYPFALTHGLNPLLNTFVNLSSGSNMMWDTTVPLPSLALWPITALFGVIAAWNVGVVAALVLGGWCTFLWLRHHVRYPLAAWFGGLLMVLGPFAVARAHAHLNFLFFFPMPLIFIEIEKLLRGATYRWSRVGVWIGVLAGIQFLCCEEMLAVGVVVVATVLVIAALVHPASVNSRLMPCAMVGGLAIAVFLVITGLPLAYQFFGPDRIVGAIQPPSTFVADAVNLIVPNDFSAVTPSFVANLSSRWSGGIVENDAYVGIPLIVVGIYTVIRWRRDSWLSVVGLGTLATIIWSLGPYLHIDGATEHVFPLPSRVLSAIPALENILPARFDVFTDLGLAALVAVFVDRAVLSGRPQSRAVSSFAFVLVLVTLAPQVPVGAYTPDTPRYFLAGGDVNSLPQGSVALVVPYGDSVLTMDPMLWQAESDFRVRMVAGTMWSAGLHGIPSFGRDPASTGSTLDCVMQLLQEGESTEPCTSTPIAAARSELNRLKVTVIIMGPMAYGTNPALGPPVEKFLSDLAGAAPRREQGALVWNYRR